MRLTRCLRIPRPRSQSGNHFSLVEDSLKPSVDLREFLTLCTPPVWRIRPFLRATPDLPPLFNFLENAVPVSGSRRGINHPTWHGSCNLANPLRSPSLAPFLPESFAPCVHSFTTPSPCKVRVPFVVLVASRKSLSLLNCCTLISFIHINLSNITITIICYC